VAAVYLSGTMEGFDPTDTDPARRLRDAADAAEAGNLMDAQIFAGQALDALLEARADQEDLVSDLGDALEDLEGVPMLEEAALDEDTPVPQRWGEGGLHRDDVPALLAPRPQRPPLRRGVRDCHDRAGRQVAPPRRNAEEYSVDTEVEDVLEVVEA